MMMVMGDGDGDGDGDDDHEQCSFSFTCAHTSQFDKKVESFWRESWKLYNGGKREKDRERGARKKSWHI